MKGFVIMLQSEITLKIIKIVKNFVITIFTYYITTKIMNKKKKIEGNDITIAIMNILIAIIYYVLRDKIGLILATIIQISLLAVLIAKNTNKNIGYSIICTSISLTINNILFFIAITIVYIPTRILNITNVYILVVCITLVYAILVNLFFKVKKIKNGFDFLNILPE